MDTQTRAAQAYELQPKKDTGYHARNGAAAEDKQKTYNEAQWKMGPPSRGPREHAEANGMHSQYNGNGYQKGVDPSMAMSMGMMAYPYDYMAWGVSDHRSSVSNPVHLRLMACTLTRQITMKADIEAIARRNATIASVTTSHHTERTR